jgi:hypothetical protein
MARGFVWHHRQVCPRRSTLWIVCGVWTSCVCHVGGLALTSLITCLIKGLCVRCRGAFPSVQKSPMNCTSIGPHVVVTGRMSCRCSSRCYWKPCRRKDSLPARPSADSVGPWVATATASHFQCRCTGSPPLPGSCTALQLTSWVTTREAFISGSELSSHPQQAVTYI